MSQAMNDLRGSLVALVTPMTASGAIDWAALDGLSGLALRVRDARHCAGGHHWRIGHADSRRT